MDIVVTGRNAEIHPNFRQAVEDKLEKVTLFYPRAQRVEVVLTHEGNPRLADRSERIELTVYGKGPVIRAEAESADRYSAVDLASAKLFERLRRMRDRVKDRRKGKGNGAPEPSELTPEIVDDQLNEDFTDAEDWALRSAEDLKVGEVREEQLGDSPVLVRQKVHEAAPMSVDEALQQMELVGHPFFLFIDQDTMQPCVAYHRKGWTYGIIRLNTRVDSEGVAHS
ncbi:ribosome-associated translation inhibitor RaiA [Actinomycetaceae bacterium MB13-C1-2]|nr:ribosome-associated translation inhibitor RaiA [Actinomycetaceae bacterium MB13-C1-2]